MASKLGPGGRSRRWAIWGEESCVVPRVTAAFTLATLVASAEGVKESGESGKGDKLLK